MKNVVERVNTTDLNIFQTGCVRVGRSEYCADWTEYSDSCEELEREGTK